ncbi:hypothetical protein HUE87_08210 [Candidatus Sulfurimonas marisnigri]|uniref:Uncharacterized protein n=1 Tax=Candidatus Sulfurimonas marisnigri TaxID=2740405 RepID=A0A7S7RPU4_9BACT|nr:hypothetical protein [Candidatus Sulfurimonas marisnigri]QOY53878.1 hypothetical protein HUE87_08210 [Candidatus Sulfurimonas marisnigri]
MSGVEKYKNIESELPKLPKVLLNTIQSDVLEIKSVDKECDKYINACAKIPNLKNAYFVVYSKYIQKSDHKYEQFIFLDSEGAEVCHVSGQQMELYGILSCTNLSYNEEYEASTCNKTAVK